jgi:hypothetical protein
MPARFDERSEASKQRRRSSTNYAYGALFFQTPLRCLSAIMVRVFTETIKNDSTSALWDYVLK